MAQQSKTWWGQRFIAALEGCMDAGRLQRGRGYSGDSRILSFDIAKALVSAKVRGNVNPYFGVYKEPKYSIQIRLTPIPDKEWKKAITTLGSNAALVSQLLMGEMPERIDEVFAGMRLHLLPQSRKDFAQTDCSCPDYANPCKHIAGVYYRLARMLDSDPFLLFELRGLSREHLHRALAKTPLGQALVAMMDTPDAALEPAASFFTRPEPVATAPDYQAFWTGRKRLPSEIEPATPPVVSGILVRKAGDYPGFWERENSFIEVMEALFERVRVKSKMK
ncbi:SWIM zinc finger protein [Thiorhodovibrio winogradskyi]|uniref:SWIM zinc finger protein n=1 Tax=Thiorhodovibrio winogradskyi TaxID=77007 RepID=A0ABZ0S8T3_9GAMM|nr:SWIM zinc finger family protein [Thiorhodovibrio winogradskyi]